jgi:hypothetical protein
MGGPGSGNRTSSQRGRKALTADQLKKSLTARLPPELLDWLVGQARERDESISARVRAILEQARNEEN